MVSQNEGLPFGTRDGNGVGAEVAVGRHGAAGAVPAEGVGTGIGGVGKDFQYPVVGERRPGQLGRATVRPSWELAPAKGPDHPVGRARCQERCEEVGHRRLDFFIGVEDYRSFVIMNVASRKPPAKLTTCGGPRRDSSRRLARMWSSVSAIVPLTPKTSLSFMSERS